MQKREYQLFYKKENLTGKINKKPMMKMLLTGEPIKANFAKEIGLILSLIHI